MDYNTSREHLILREYGRNVQNIINFINSETDKEKRSKLAESLVQLMKQITPHRKEQMETDQKYWDDMHIISDFSLDVDSPFEIPDKELINRRPDPLPYMSNRLRYRHYGRNIELLILEAIKKEDPQERENAVIYIGKLMKSFYSTWNNEMIDDAIILKDIKSISGGELDIDLDKVKEENLFEKLYKNKKKPRPGGSGKPQKSGRKGGKRRRSY